MNGMNFKPFIAKLLDSLSDEQVKALYDLVNSHSNNFKKRSLIDNSNLLTTSDKGIGLYTIQLDSETIKTGYLIYNDTHCVLLGYVSNSERVSEYVIDMTKKTWSMVKEFITTDYFRHEVAIRAVSVGELVEVEVDDINSDDEAAGKVIVTDGEGGAEWQTPNEMAPVGDASYLLGIDASGNLVKDEIPTGIVVDQSVIEDSTNPVSGGAVFDELALKADKSTTYTKTETDALLEDKANVDGNYPTMTVGVADNLSPYDEESGADQDEPFNFQATGTDNGTDLTFSTGAIGLMKEKQGNSVVVNQLAYDAVSSTYTSLSVTEYSTGKGYANLTANACDNLVVGHEILVIASFTNTSSNFEYADIKVGGNTFYGTGFFHGTVSNNDYKRVRVYTDDLDPVSATLFLKIIDLTQWFNGDIPQDLLDNPSNFYRYYQGSLEYNTGTIIHGNAQYIKCIGRQQWDEEWELGAINTSGVNYSTNDRIRSKNYIRVISNATYYFKMPWNYIVFWFDAQKNLLSYGYFNEAQGTISVPTKTCYMRFCSNETATIYNHDITISIYYSGESGYDQYYPYEVLTNNDTGTEVLRSAGSVKDSKAPDGTITRRIGVVDLGTLNKNETTYTNIFTVSLPNNFKANVMICDKFVYVDDSRILDNGTASSYLSIGQFAYRHGTTDRLYFCANSISDITGILYYELAEPTTEQGTPFTENLIIDDFGSMSFEGTSGVPQGNLIFYPVDYKAFIDTLFNQTSGDPDNLALKSDLSADKSELQGADTQLLNAIGGTLRHCLAVQESGLDFEDTDVVDLGTLTWYYDDVNKYFIASITSGSKPQRVVGNKFICSKYPTGTNRDDAGCISPYNSESLSTDLYVNDTSYTDATAFKAAMKGVLLAYEKASE